MKSIAVLRSRRSDYINPTHRIVYKHIDRSHYIMAPGDKLPDFLTNTPLHQSFDEDIRDTHLIYDYDAQDENGNPEKWRYELWCFSDTRVVYAIHGGM
jgi:hypothetical protein